MKGENVFRQANERIAVKARALGFAQDVPFICECANRDCIRTVSTSLESFERILDTPGASLTLPGHPQPRPGIDAAA